MPKTGDEITKQVEEKERADSDRTKRQDADFDWWDLKKKIFEDHTEAINIVSNDPRTFADKLQRGLTARERQIIIRPSEEEGEDERDDIAKLERLLGFLLDKADEKLMRRLLIPLRDSLIWDGLVRGWMVARILTYKSKGGEVIADYMRLDPRWVTFEVGKDGIAWANHKTFRSEDKIKEEYKKDVSSWLPFRKEKKNITVLDFYDDVYNYVVINGEIVKREKHNMPVNPILILPMATRPSVMNETEVNIAGFGDSIFASSRDIGDIENQMLSIWATQAQRIAREVMIQEKATDEVPDITSVTGSGVINIPMGKSKIYPIGLKEVSPTLMNLMGLLGGKIQRATLSRLDLGEFGSPAPSGTFAALVMQEATASQLIVNALNSFYSQMCNMIELQLISKKISVDVVGEQDRKFYSFKVTPVELKKAHLTRVEFTARTNWEQLETYQIADMAKKQGIPQEFIDEFILKFPDPKGMKDKRAIEIVEMSPDAIRQTAIEKYEKLGRDKEALRLKVEIGMEGIAREREMLGEQTQGPPAPPSVPRI